jgi:hypothetical protein
MILDVNEDERLYDILHRKIMIAEQISKLTRDDIQEVMNGNTTSEFRLHILMKLAKLDSAVKALEAEELILKKESVRNKTASSQSWYKNALIGSWCL